MRPEVFRVVLDTNVYISAFCFTKSTQPTNVYIFALQGRFELWASTKILLELADKLQNKFAWAPPQVERVIRQIARHAHLAEPKHRISVIDADPSDNRILECALAADAHFIVSGDKHLLALKKFNDTTIMNPSDFIALFRD